MNLKPFITTATAALAIICSAAATAAEGIWTTDFAAAKKEAAASGKALFIDFTGSDWCGYCIALDKEVFSHEKFKAEAKKNLVPVLIDFPKDTSKMSAETIKQNEELQKTYGVEGYPTILLTDAEGKPFASTGYREGGPDAYVKHLEALLATRKVRDVQFKAAADATGVAKAKALYAGLTAMDLSDSLREKFYAAEVAAIKEADPKDETGFAKDEEAKARFAKFQQELNGVAQNNDMAAAHALVDKTLKEGGFRTADTQQVMMVRAMIFAQEKKFDDALKAIEEARKLAPESEIAVGAESLKEQIEKAKAGGDVD